MHEFEAGVTGAVKINSPGSGLPGEKEIRDGVPTSLWDLVQRVVADGVQQGLAAGVLHAFEVQFVDVAFR